MTKGLIITEKPSVARDITNALGGFTEHDNGEYFESDDFVCTYAVGHLLGLVEPEDMDPAYKRWSLNNLPIIPEEFKLKAKPGQNKRLACIKKLANRKDVTYYINACDAAREGELIFREIDDYVANGKPTKRLWLQSMTQAAIKKGFESLRDGQEIIGLGEAAECRSQADWLIGMNATRALSVRLRTKAQKGAWSAGRVQTPTLALLVNREIEILDFKPDDYWQISAKFKVNNTEYIGYYHDHEFKKNEDQPELRADRIFDYHRAQRIIEEITGKVGLASETRKPRESKAPILFNLTALQKNMSSRYGWSAKRTLQAAQRCYEQHKVLTYPRTSSSNLPEDYKQEVDKILSIYAKTQDYGEHAQYLINKGRLNEKLVFDDSGVTDHFAIIPTGQMSATLSGDDIKLYDAVVRRFLAVFYPPAVYDKVERKTIVAQHVFKTGPVETLVKPGWLAVYDKLQEEKEKQEPLPELTPGQQNSENVKVELDTSEIHKEQTKPPSRIGEARLLSLMEHAGRHVEDEELATALTNAEGLGTAATRADIIENLKTKEYVDSTLRPTPKGIRLIDTLVRMNAARLTSAELTAQLEIHLTEVENRKRTKGQFLEEITNYVKEIVEHVKEFDYDKMYPDVDPLGRCPVCKKEKYVYEKAWFYACETNSRESENGCGLMLWKDCYGRYLNRKTAMLLLTEGKTGELDGFHNSNGQAYKGEMLLEGNKITIKPIGSAVDSDAVRFEINADPIAPCPISKDKTDMIIETDTHFVSQSRKKAMDEGQTKIQGFILPRSICKREITREEVLQYIALGETPVITDFLSKKGRKFKAKLKLKPDGRHEFEFPPREAASGSKKQKNDLDSNDVVDSSDQEVVTKPAAKKKTAKKVVKSVDDGDESVAPAKKKQTKVTAAKKTKKVTVPDDDLAPF